MAFETIAQIRALLDLLNRHRDPALRAAIAKEASGWNRERVATAYGVTPHQLDHRRGQAEKLLADLKRQAQ